MTATIVDITIPIRGSFRMVVEVVDQDEQILDLTGYSGAMQIRLDPADTDPVVEATVTINTTTGEVTATLEPSQTQTLDFAAALYDLRIVDGTGLVVEYIAKGKASLEPTITR